MSKENNLNNAIKAVEKGIELQEQDDLERAASSYKEAIETIEASEIIENLVLAKARLAEVQLLLEKITETEEKRLLEKIKTGYESLKDIEIKRCGECKRRGRDGYCIVIEPPCDNSIWCIVCQQI